MATNTLNPVIAIVLLFVSRCTSNSLLCDHIQLCNDDIGSGWDRRCTLNSSYVTHCCRSMTDDLAHINDNFTMKFSGVILDISELLIANMTFENCAKPIIIEDMMTVEIMNVTFRY